MTISLLNIKIKNAFTYGMNLIIFFMLRNKKAEIKKNTLLLIRLDAIGDYVLIRNFIRLLKITGRYKDYRITLCGNIAWKDLAETFDNDCVDEFIWLDRNKFYSGFFYRYRLLKLIRQKGFESVIDLTYSREILYGDSIINAGNALEKIGSLGSPDSHVKWKRNLFSNKYYTKLIPASSENLFEFYRNKDFFEHLTNERLNIHTISINHDKVEIDVKLPERYAVLFPGANEEKRKWAVEYYGDVAKHLVKEFNLIIIVAGSKTDKNIAASLVAAADDEIMDLTGKTTLSQLAKVIGNSKILISNETGAVHISAAVKTPFICISNGNHYGRFHPYPKEVFDKAYYVYPGEIERNFDNPEFLNKYRFGSDLDINSITPERVKEKINEVLNY